MDAFYCNVCLVPCGNADNWVAHVGGKVHLSKIKNNVPHEQLFCLQCKLQFMNLNNFEQHKKSTAHNQRCHSLGITAIPPQRPPVQVVYMDVDLDDFDDDDFIPTVVVPKPAVTPVPAFNKTAIVLPKPAMAFVPANVTAKPTAASVPAIITKPIVPAIIAKPTVASVPAVVTKTAAVP